MEKITYNYRIQLKHNKIICTILQKRKGDTKILTEGRPKKKFKKDGMDKKTKKIEVMILVTILDDSTI